MTSTLTSATPRSRPRHQIIRHVLFLVLVSFVLAACQSTPSALPSEATGEEFDSLAINVVPATDGSGDLDGQTVSGTIVISVPVEGWMRSVRFLIGEERLHTASSEPFEFELDTRGLVDGPHVLTIEALRANGRVGATKSAAFAVSNDDAGPEGPATESPTPEPPSDDPPAPEPPSDDPPAPEPPSVDPPAPEPPSVDPPAPSVRALTMRGDPTFAPAQLSALERGEYDRLWRQISDSGNYAAVMKQAGSDDIFTYGRTLHGYLQSVLTAFRVTGDLRLLDHVDEILERMRSELRDEWRGTNDGTDGTRDGYLNWSYKYSDTPTHQGKDTRHIDDIKTHGIVAMVAYALELNRDLASPSGRNYGAHADFWRDYLVNHFEAKWRERRKVSTAFPFLHHSDAHTYWTWTKWHLYMGMLTGDQRYTNEANRMADVIWNEIKSTNVAGGPAFVWASNITALSSSRNYLMSTGYAHSVYGDVVTFHLEGFHRWADEANVRAFARTITSFVFDTSDPSRHGIAADIGGGEDQAGIVSDSGRPRRTASAFVGYQYALIGGWDVSGRVIDVTFRIDQNHASLNTTRLASGLLLSARLHPVATAAAVNGTSMATAASR